MERPANVLIVLLGAIGDVVRGLPLAVRMKRAWPETKITWAVEPKSADIVRGHAAIDEVLLFDRPKGFREFRRFLREVRSRRFDVTLDLQRHLKSGVTSRASRARRRIGFHRENAKELNWIFNNQHIPFADDTLPKVQHYQLFGDMLDLPPLKPLEFDLPMAERNRAEELIAAACEDQEMDVPPPEKRVGLLIGGSWESKRWPPERFRELAAQLNRELQFSCFLLGAPAETSIAHQVQLGPGAVPIANLAGKTTLPELAAVIAVMNFVVGGDCGPMHMAAAIGTPAISLWGPTDPIRTGPYGSESLILSSPIGCAPCYRRKCPGLDKLCMFDIPSEAVMARVQQLLRAP